MKIIVFSDRDGTINLDENYYLGSSPNWKNQVSFLEGVVEGIRKINSISNSYFCILTNQSGVSLKGDRFNELTLERMHEVNKYIVDKLYGQGAKVDCYFACPYVDLAYVENARKKGKDVNEEFVREGHPDLKPSPGMIEKALKSINLKREDCKIFMIGDRLSDVKTGLNAGGTGILVKSNKTREVGDIDEVKKLEGLTYVAKNFLDAVEYILNNC